MQFFARNIHEKFALFALTISISCNSAGENSNGLACQKRIPQDEIIDKTIKIDHDFIVIDFSSLDEYSYFDGKHPEFLYKYKVAN